MSRWIAICLALSVVPFGSARSEESCADILSSGVHNTYQQSDINNLKSDYRNHLCSENTSVKEHRLGGSGSGNYLYKIQGNASFNTSQVENLHSKYCSDNSADMSDDDLDTLVTQTIDPFVVKNWQECMDSHARGLLGNVDLNGSTVIFTMEWRGGVGAYSTKVLSDPDTVNITCKPRILEGTTLNTNSSITEICSRNSDDEVTFVVNTINGSKTLKLSAVQHETDLPPKLPPKARYISSYHTTDLQNKIIETQRTFVESTAFGDHKNLRISFVAPKQIFGFLGAPPNSPTTFDTLYFLLDKVDQAQVLGHQTITLLKVTGNWEPGSVVKAGVDLPNTYTADDGWRLTYCLVAGGSPCNAGPNILIGNPIEQP